MKKYSNFTVEITLQSPIITPFQSDTIFGHICWAIRFLQWHEVNKLDDFLKCYDSNDGPPFLVSAGFPKGYLPKPIILPITQHQLEEIVGREDRIETSYKIKALKNIPILPKQDFFQLQKAEITPLKLFKVLFERYEIIARELTRMQPMVVQHNTVNRIQNRVVRGLYAQEEFFSDREGGKFEIYLKTNYFSSDDLERIFEYVAEEGFGKDKSTGKGYFEFEIKEGIDLPEPQETNAFMTLSSFIPTEQDPTNGHYRITHKYGKLGGLYAKGVPDVDGNPFKRPLIMFSPGSTFYDDTYSSAKVYGSLLKNVHHNEKIRHYAYAFPIGMNLGEKYEDT
ncbi:hypothetical protein KA005_23335 [bacterium]|nr:hypothetical protein [bacterium]